MAKKGQKKEDQQPRHPSRRNAGSDDESNDALEYYKPKKKKASKKNAKVVDGDEAGSKVVKGDAAGHRVVVKGDQAKEPEEDPPLTPPSRSSARRPGAFRMAHMPNEDGEAPTNSSSSSHSQSGNSMVVIPNASLVVVVAGDDVQDAQVSPLPELVHAAPLQIRPPQPIHHKPAHDAEDCSTQDSLPRSSDATSAFLNNPRLSQGDSDSNRLVLVLNKRWIMLACFCCCLAVAMVIVGAVYYALDKGGGGGGAGGGGGGGGGTNDEENSSSDSNSFRPPPRRNSSRDLLRGMVGH